jgi:Lar family restriction alleviation protein
MTEPTTPGAPAPCPFCGESNVTVEEGSTFRWRVPMCTECGASAGEVRVQTLGNGTNDEWEAKARENAIKEWNRRTPPQPDLAVMRQALDALLNARKIRACEGGTAFADDIELPAIASLRAALSATQEVP